MAHNLSMDEVDTKGWEVERDEIDNLVLEKNGGDYFAKVMGNTTLNKFTVLFIKNGDYQDEYEKSKVEKEEALEAFQKIIDEN